MSGFMNSVENYFVINTYRKLFTLIPFKPKTEISEVSSALIVPGFLITATL